MLRPATYQPALEIDAVKLQSWPEHDAIYHRATFPYVLRLERGSGKVLYIGARPTRGCFGSRRARQLAPSTNRSWCASREVRGEHMVRTLVDLAVRGERVLAVVGASHVIRQEPALGKALEASVVAPTGANER